MADRILSFTFSNDRWQFKIASEEARSVASFKANKINFSGIEITFQGVNRLLSK